MNMKIRSPIKLLKFKTGVLSGNGRLVLQVCILLLLGVLLVNAGYDNYREIRRRGNEQAYYESLVASCVEPELIPHVFSLREGKNGYYFTSVDGQLYLLSVFFAPYITGYGGPIELLINLEEDYRIKQVIILNHTETQEWIDKISGWIDDLEGRQLIRPDALESIDAFSGATYTSGAILEILKKTGRDFEKVVIKGESPTGTAASGFVFTSSFFVLLGLFLVAVWLRRKPKKWFRISFMILVVIVLGFRLNLQFSTYHIKTLAGAAVHLGGFDNNLFFFILMPLALLVTGNMYCGYLCPFGLLQELVSDTFFFLKLKIPASVDAFARLVKYALLFLILLSVLIPALEPLGKIDILLVAFMTDISPGGFLVLVLLGLSAVFNRFWCRYLCPTGAFLTILHNVAFLSYKRLSKRIPLVKKQFIIPAIKNCDLGIRNIKDNNCICCDRCRYAVPGRNRLSGGQKKYRR